MYAMMVFLSVVFFSAIFGCASDGRLVAVDDKESWYPSGLPVEAAPLPQNLTLTINEPFFWGGTAIATVSDATPNDVVSLIVGSRAGPLACHIKIDNNCLDIATPLWWAGSSPTDPSGVAVFAIDLPSGVGDREVAAQAVETRGNNGEASVVSNPVFVLVTEYTEVQPQYDRFSDDAPFDCTGGRVMSISGEIDAEGMLIVYGRKADGSTFGSGVYTVKVFSPDDVIAEQCWDNNVSKVQMNVSGSPSEIQFPRFDPVVVPCGGTKNWCIGKEVSGNDTYYCSGLLEGWKLCY